MGLEQRRKLSQALRGRENPGAARNLGKWGTKGFKWPHPKRRETREKIRSALLGVPFPEARRQNISRACLGRTPWNKGKKHPKVSGPRSNFWRGGVSAVHVRLRSSLEYKIWRRAVFERDNYTCVWCGDDRGHNLQADHIKPFSQYPELRFAIDNGRTLCRSCHMKTPTFGMKALLGEEEAA